jgi:hypothetical protein
MLIDSEIFSVANRFLIRSFSWSASKIAAAEQVRIFEILTSLSAAGEDQGKPSVSFKQMALIFPS